MGAIAGSNLFIAREAPKYPTGYGTSMAFTACGALMACFLRFAYGRENKKKAQLLAELGEEGIRARYSEQELLDMGDRSPFFKYAL